MIKILESSTLPPAGDDSADDDLLMSDTDAAEDDPTLDNDMTGNSRMEMLKANMSRFKKKLAVQPNKKKKQHKEA